MPSVKAPLKYGIGLETDFSLSPVFTELEYYNTALHNLTLTMVVFPGASGH